MQLLNVKQIITTIAICCSRIGSIMVSVLDSNAVDRGSDSQFGQNIDDKIDNPFFTAKCTALRRKSEDQINIRICLPADCCFRELTL